jgi:hypothetical protein
VEWRSAVGPEVVGGEPLAVRSVALVGPGFVALQMARIRSVSFRPAFEETFVAGLPWMASAASGPQGRGNMGWAWRSVRTTDRALMPESEPMEERKRIRIWPGTPSEPPSHPWRGLRGLA